MVPKGLNHVKYVLHIFEYMEKNVDQTITIRCKVLGISLSGSKASFSRSLYTFISPSITFLNILSLCDGKKYHLHTKTLQL